MQLTQIHAPTGYTQPLNEAHPEYPKWVHFAGKPSVIVKSAEEETLVLGGGEPAEPASVAVPVAPIPMLVGTNDERAMLLQIAEARGIRVDRRWKTPKIRAAVDAASPRTEG